jgi:hypothetical protein
MMRYTLFFQIFALNGCLSGSRVNCRDLRRINNKCHHLFSIEIHPIQEGSFPIEEVIYLIQVEFFPAEVGYYLPGEEYNSIQVGYCPPEERCYLPEFRGFLLKKDNINLQ